MDMKVAIAAYFISLLFSSAELSSIQVERFVQAPLAATNYVPFIMEMKENVLSTIQCGLICKLRSPSCDGYKFLQSSQTCHLVDFDGVSNAENSADGFGKNGLMIKGSKIVKSSGFCNGGVWTKWSSWSSCDGAEIPTSTRNRTCITPFIGDSHCSTDVGEASSIDTKTCVLHLLVVGGLVEDFSLDPINSPAVTTYPTSFPNVGPYSGYMMTTDRELHMLETLGGSRIYRWGFDSQLPVELATTIPFHGDYPGVTSTSRAIYAFGGEGNIYGIDEYVPGGEPFSTTFADGLTYGCAAAVPQDDSVIYIGGGVTNGSRTNKVWTYDTSTKAFSYRTAIPTRGGYGISSHGCAGVIAANGQKAYVVLGGYNQNYGMGNNVHMYYIDSDQWTNLASLPAPRYHFTTIFHGGYMYIAGTGGSYASRLVLRMQPDPALASWETIGSISDLAWKPIVQPYYV